MPEDKTPDDQTLMKRSLASTTVASLATSYTLAKAYVEMKKPPKK
jgi:hypothetical protein